jgi:hypothetical protein
MKIKRVFPVLLLFGAFGLAACDNDPADSGPQLSDFQGTWTSTSIVYSDPTTGTALLNATAAGAILTLNVAANGTFAGVFNFPAGGFDNTALTGLLSNLTGTTVDVAFDWGQAPAIIGNFNAQYTLSGNVLAFTNPSTTVPGTETPASLTITMTRS